jgi:2-hydroxy-3-keto-5-methylthiopentenyl-1-phosphate phosphatase
MVCGVEIEPKPQNNLRVYVEDGMRYVYSAEMCYYVIGLYEELLGEDALNNENILQDEDVWDVTLFVQRTDPEFTYNDVYRILSLNAI